VYCRGQKEGKKLTQSTRSIAEKSMECDGKKRKIVKREKYWSRNL